MTSHENKPDDSGDEKVLILLFLFQEQFFPSRLTACDMQTANISCGTGNTAVVIDDKGGGGEDAVEQEGLTGIREVEEVLDQLETIRMDIQQAEGLTRKSPASGKQRWHKMQPEATLNSSHT